MKLYENNNGTYKFLKEVKDPGKALDIISSLLDNKGEKVYSYNCHKIVKDGKEGLNVDYGSWSNFYFIKY